MEVDLQSLFGLHVTWCAQLHSLADTPQLPPPPPLLDSYTRAALLVSKDRRHLFVTPWTLPTVSELQLCPEWLAFVPCTPDMDCGVGEGDGKYLMNLEKYGDHNESTHIGGSRAQKVHTQ
jgi:hypothetical protein